MSPPKKWSPRPSRLGQVEDDLQVGPRLVHGRDNGRPELRPGAGVLRQTVRRRGRQHGLGLPAAGRGQEQVGQASARVGEQVCVHVEVECLEGLLAEQRIGVREQGVGPERDQGPHPIGLSGEDGPVDVGRPYHSGFPGRAQRAFGVAKATRRLPGREQRTARHGVRGGAGEQDVAAALVELAGQRVKQADRTVGLHGVAALFQPRPRVVAGWPLAGEQPYRPADQGGRDPGEGLRPLGGVAGRELSEQLQRGPAADRLSAGAGDPIGPGQRGLDLGPVVPAAGSVGRRTAAAAIPDDEAIRVRGRGQARPGQQLAGIRADQERGVGPVPDEVLVAEALLEQDVDHAQGQRAVGTRPDPQPKVGLAGQRRPARIDDDQPGTVRGGLADPHRHARPGRPGVETPQQDAAGMLVVRRRGAHPVGVCRAPVPVPLADVGVRHDVGAAEGIGQTPGPGHEVDGRAARRGGNRERHRLGPVPGLDLQQARRRQRQRLVPRDASPAGVRIVLGVRADHRVPQAVRSVDELGSRRSLHADAPVRVGGIRGHLRQHALADGGHHTAVGHAHSAVGMNLPDSHRSPRSTALEDEPGAEASQLNARQPPRRPPALSHPRSGRRAGRFLRCDKAEDFTSNGLQRRCPPTDKRGRLPGVRYAAGDAGDQRGREPIALFCAHAGGPLQGRRSPAITAIASDCLWGHHIAGQRAASLITGPGARLIQAGRAAGLPP